MKMKIGIACIFLLLFVTFIYKFASTPREDVKIQVFHLNTATKEDLMKLNGVGSAIADRILTYRETAGFTKKEDIKKVKGIGDKLYEKIKKNIEVEAK